MKAKSRKGIGGRGKVRYSGAAVSARPRIPGSVVRMGTLAWSLRSTSGGCARRRASAACGPRECLCLDKAWFPCCCSSVSERIRVVAHENRCSMCLCRVVRMRRLRCVVVVASEGCGGLWLRYDVRKYVARRLKIMPRCRDPRHC